MQRIQVALQAVVILGAVLSAAAIEIYLALTDRFDLTWPDPVQQKLPGMAPNTFCLSVILDAGPNRIMYRKGTRSR